MTTPTIPTLLAVFSFLFLASPALAIRADTRSALDKKHAEINAVVGEIQRKVKYLRDRGLLCTSYPKVVNDMFLAPTERKHVGFKAEIDTRLAKLKAEVKSKPATFANVDACEGYKSAAVGDLNHKKGAIEEARKTFRNDIIRPVNTDLQKLYKEQNTRLMGKTPFEALSSAFEKTDSVPNCPADALKVFHSLAHPRNDSAEMNKFAGKMLDLDKQLDAYGDSLDAMVADIQKIKCDTAAAAPLPPERPRTQELPPAADPKTDPKTDPKAEPRTGSGPQDPPKAEPRPAPESTEPPPITESDRWGKPKSWKEYDDYKTSIGAPNRVSGVDLNANYESFLSTNGIQVRNADDALRLQKAINATTMEVAGPDGIGPSVYQDGQVGSRTKSALYLMQNDPYYRDALLANLRKQGLLR